MDTLMRRIFSVVVQSFIVVLPFGCRPAGPVGRIRGQQPGRERITQPHMPNSETPRSTSVTSSRFERRLAPGRLEPVFKTAFGSFGKAAARARG